MSSWYDYFLDSITPQEFKPKKRTTNISLEPEVGPVPFETKLSESGLGTESLALSDRSKFAGLPTFSTVPIKPKPPKHPGIQELIAEPIAKAGEWALTPQLPKEEEELTRQSEKLGYIPSLLADYYVEGASSPIGILGNLPAIGLPAKAALTGAAKIASSLGGAKAGGAALAGIPFFKLAKQVDRIIPNDFGPNTKIKGLQEINDKPVLFRGDPGISGGRDKPYEYVNPQYYNRQDTLGWMTHMAEEPKYPESYAYKRGSPVKPTQMESHLYNPAARPTITPLTSTAENAIDLTRIPEGEDYDTLIKAIERWDPSKSPFGRNERVTRDRAREIIKQLPAAQQRQAAQDLAEAEGRAIDLGTDPYGWEKSNRESLMVDARAVLNDPENAAKAGWDAIRYDDMGHMSWAFSDVGKLETPWGTKIGRSSMGQYPYRLETNVMSTLPSGKVDIVDDTLGHFATPKEAAREGLRRGMKPNDIDIYLGEHLLTRPEGEGFGLGGLQEYLGKDKQIQAHTLKPTKNEMAQSLYGEPYSNLSYIAKGEIDKKFDKLNTNKKPNYTNPSAAKNALANSLYGADYDKLGATAQNSIDDHIMGNKIYGTGKSIDEPYALSDKEGEYLTSPDYGPTHADYDSMSNNLYGKNYDDLSYMEKNNVNDAVYSTKPSSSSPAIDATLNALNQGKYGVQTYKVTEDNLKKFASKGSALDPISEHFYGKKYEDLAPGESDWVWDVSTAALDLEKAGLIKSDVPFTGTNKLKEAAAKVGSAKLDINQTSLDMYGKPLTDLTDKEYNNVVAVVKKSEKVPPALKD